MPLYECLTSKGTLTSQQREQLASDITSIHTQETGSPADFIHVVFPEVESGHFFTAGKTTQATAVIRGQIRAGRPLEVRHAMIRRIFDAYSALTGASAMDIVVALLDVPASWAMEGGMIMPEPTKQEEEAWFAKLKSTGSKSS